MDGSVPASSVMSGRRATWSSACTLRVRPVSCGPDPWRDVTRLRVGGPCSLAALDERGDRGGEATGARSQLGVAGELEHPFGGLDERRGRFHRRDEAISAPMRGLDEAAAPRIVAAGSPDLADAAGQHRWGDVRRGPDGVQQLLPGDQASRMRGQIHEHREGLQSERHLRVTPKETAGRLVDTNYNRPVRGG
jgi:hypothetical protein